MTDGVKVYFVATPIGNLGEITLRALEVLKAVDEIYCEDTRRTSILLQKYDIKKPLFSYHKFNEKKISEVILEKVKSGTKVALLSDAGMPGISDPGSELIKTLIDAGENYTVISGACALINAFVISGFDTPFTFAGFLPEKNVDKKKLLDTLALKNTLIFYSSVHNINDDLEYLFDKLGNREVCVLKELTKLHEMVYRGTLENLRIEQPKGEFVIVVSKSKTDEYSDLSVKDHLNVLIKAGYDKKEAIKLVAKERNIPKSEIYKQALELE